MLHLAPARRNRLILVAALAIMVLVFLWVARSALVPYIFALAVAYILLPMVNRLENSFKRVFRGGSARFARLAAILLTYVLVLGALVLFFALVVPVIAQQFAVLWDSRAQLAEQGQVVAANIVNWYERAVPLVVQERLLEVAQEAGGTVARSLQAGLLGTLTFVTDTFGFVLGLIVIPFWLFYVLYDQAKAMRGAFNLVPARRRADVLNLARIVDDILSAYLRGQLLLCVFIFVVVTVSLMLLGVRFPAVLGLIAGILEIIPFIGPIMGAVPAVIVATIQDPFLGLWTLLLFIGIQQLENIFLVPRISGRAVQLHPAVIMVVLVLGNQAAGFWGLLLAVPVTAIVRDVFKYLYLRFQDEPVSPRDAMTRVGRTPLQLDV